MRFKLTFAFAVVLALPVLLTGMRLEADGILKRHLHPHADCPADQSTTVRLPAQQIRVETTAPRVIVNDVSSSHHRMRGFFPAGGAMVPMMQAPFAVGMPVTFHATVLGTSNSGGGNSALDALHAYQKQEYELEVAKAQVQVQMSFLEKANQRIKAATPAQTPGATVVDPVQLKTAIDNLANRIDRIEKLLILHAEWIETKKK